MKFTLSVLSLALLLASCQKDLSSKSDISTVASVSSDALNPLPFHSVSFATDYPATNSPQPFKFTKTLYPDTRVSSLTMDARANINSPYIGGAKVFNFKYQFAYSTNKATIIRQYKFDTHPTYSEVFEQPYKYECTLNNDGYCTEINYAGPGATTNRLRLSLTYSGKRLTQIYVPFVDAADEQTGTFGRYDVVYDANGNVTAITPVPNNAYPGTSVFYTYNLNKKGNYCYMPTQYAFSQWFSLLEVMQWVPLQVNERKSVSLKVVIADFSGEVPVNRTIAQGQSYYNHKYDVNGNLISYTYGDGVAQKITWK